jgi:hypothetical protein
VGATGALNNLSTLMQQTNKQTLSSMILFVESI